MESTSHFLVNLLAILVSLLFLQYWLNQPKLKKAAAEMITIFCLAISIALCMLMPVTTTSGIVFDLRFIPFVIGCFYANRLTRIGMIGLIILLRLLEGYHHAWLAIVNILLIYFFIMALKKTFIGLPVTSKITLSSFLMFLMSAWTLAGVKWFLHIPVTLSFAINYIFIQTGGMFIVGYMVESIREQHLVIRRLIRMEKMEVVSHLAASISHEIRNPLTTTRGFLQLLAESGDIPADKKEYISIAVNELDRAEGIIRDYLAFAKPAPERIETLDIKKEIEKAVRILEPLAKMNTVEITADLNACTIAGNSVFLQQTLINIIKNGIEAMPNGGKLSIDAIQEYSTVSITIADEGIGMDELQKSRLGEPYFSTKESKGTGLGMMVVFRLVESMRGIIQVNSEKGKGTAITLTFPAIAADSKQRNTMAQATAAEK
ncbi:sensor histidine kinase [Heyndrickxia acidiproducens]|uniref:sensor histidine kinase n=1 Tax=Heyndrickxia acidiproducens TaxID=1121084 RepID=UPI00037FEDC8|nr:HAMP domain-containing sensor histidine kinase [Heyndrickxia acidiproducens]